MKVVLNKCYGGFSLSPKAELRLYETGCEGLRVRPVDEYFGAQSDKKQVDLMKWRDYLASTDQRGVVRTMFLTVFTPDEKFCIHGRDVKRSDPRLVAVVEEMGKDANGDCSDLRIIEIPDGTEYEISEYDGIERCEAPRQFYG